MAVYRMQGHHQFDRSRSPRYEPVTGGVTLRCKERSRRRLSREISPVVRLRSAGLLPRQEMFRELNMTIGKTLPNGRLPVMSRDRNDRVAQVPFQNLHWRWFPDSTVSDGMILAFF